MYLLKRQNGKVSILNPVGEIDISAEIEKWEAANREKVLSYEQITLDQLPPSRNWRDAWSVNDNGEVIIDLEKAKNIHKKLIAQKARERLPKDDFGDQDFSTVKTELDTIDFEGIVDLDGLFNAWPKSIENRKGTRKYNF